MIRRFIDMGPAALITAAFIGPGTVTVCTMAGSYTAYQLLWTIPVAIIITIVLQEIVARVSVASKANIEDNIMSMMPNKASKWLMLMLIIAAIIIGNTAYQIGNLLGTELGISLLWRQIFEVANPKIGITLASVVAIALLWKGKIDWIKNAMSILVGVMSVAFLIAAFAARPDWGLVLKGLVIPSIPADQSNLVLSIIGTTVVPYNIFLYAYLIKSDPDQDLKVKRQQLYLSIIIGGIISLAIVIAAAAMGNSNVTSAADLAESVKSISGPFAYILVGIGLFAAGMSSSVTAPLAVAIVLTNLLHWNEGLSSIRAKMTSIAVVLIATLSAYMSYKPLEVIKFSQMVNGFLLPILAIILLVLANNRTIMKHHKNTWYQNILIFIVIIFCAVQSIKFLSTIL